MGKQILCLDFDGVLHSYTSGWKGAAVIPDPPVEGAMKFVMRASEVFRIAVFSSRSNQDGGIDAMRAWLFKHLVDQHKASEQEDVAICFAGIEWPREKPPAFVTIDDRAITFTGQWPALHELLAFKPWNK